jgi:hypothetical protein
MEEFTAFDKRFNDNFAQQHTVLGYEILRVYKVRNQKAGYKIPLKFLQGIRKTLSMKMGRKSKVRCDKLKTTSYLSKKGCDVSVSDFSESNDSQYTHSRSSSKLTKDCDTSLDSLQFSLGTSFEEGKSHNLLPLISDDNNIADEDNIFNIKLPKQRFTNDITQTDGSFSEISLEEAYHMNCLEEAVAEFNKSVNSDICHGSMSYSADDGKEVKRSEVMYPAEYCHRLSANAIQISNVRAEERMAAQPSSATEMFDSSDLLKSLQNSLSYSTEDSQGSEEVDAAYAVKRCHLLPEIFFEDGLHDEEMLLSPVDSSGTNLLGFVKTCKKGEKIMDSYLGWNGSLVSPNICEGTDAATIISEMQYSSVLNTSTGSNILGSEVTSPGDSDLPLIIECLTSNTDFTEASGDADYDEDERVSHVQNFSSRRCGDDNVSVVRCTLIKKVDTSTNSSTKDRTVNYVPFTENRTFLVLLTSAVLLTTLFHPNRSNMFARSVVRSNADSRTQLIEIDGKSLRACGKKSSINLDGKLSQTRHIWKRWQLDIDGSIIHHLGRRRGKKKLARVRSGALSFEEIIMMSVESMLQ